MILAGLGLTTCAGMIDRVVAEVDLLVVQIRVSLASFYPPPSMPAPGKETRSGSGLLSAGVEYCRSTCIRAELKKRGYLLYGGFPELVRKLLFFLHNSNKQIECWPLKHPLPGCPCAGDVKAGEKLRQMFWPDSVTVLPTFRRLSPDFFTYSGWPLLDANRCPDRCHTPGWCRLALLLRQRADKSGSEEESAGLHMDTYCTST